MTLPEIDNVSFLVEHAQTFFAGELDSCESWAQLLEAWLALTSV